MRLQIDVEWDASHPEALCAMTTASEDSKTLRVGLLDEALMRWLLVEAVKSFLRHKEPYTLLRIELKELPRIAEVKDETEDV